MIMFMCGVGQMMLHAQIYTSTPQRTSYTMYGAQMHSVNQRGVSSAAAPAASSVSHNAELMASFASTTSYEIRTMSGDNVYADNRTSGSVQRMHFAAMDLQSGTCLADLDQEAMVGSGIHRAPPKGEFHPSPLGNIPILLMIVLASLYAAYLYRKRSHAF